MRPAARRAQEAWPLALSLGLVTAVVPFLVGLGDPVRLLEEGRGAPLALMHGRVARVLTFPLVASVLSAAVLTVAVTVSVLVLMTETLLLVVLLT